MKNTDIEDKFDKNQKRAIRAILDDCIEEDGFVLPIIDGPPGTGKTTVGTAAIASYLRENPGGQVVYMCYTHYAAEQGKKTLHDKFDIPSKDLIQLTPYGEKDWENGVIGCKSDLSDLSRNEMRRLKESPVLFTTLYGSKRAREARKAGARMIVDEFSQVDPPMFFMTINRLRDINPTSFSLLGDPLQLPVVTTQKILRPNIGHYIKQRKPYKSHELNIQHRMHGDICAGINSIREKIFHTYELKSSEFVKDRDMEDSFFGYRWKKSDIDQKYRDILDPAHPLVIVNTDSLDGMEELTEGGTKKYVEEAKLAKKLWDFAYGSFVKENGERLESTILSPYNGQIYEILSMFKKPRNQCISVYRSQGREYPLVIVSFVRKNPWGGIGFLDDIQLRAQTYVACSRAQAKLIVLLSKDTFVEKGHIIFDALYKTEEAYKVDAPT